MIITERAWTSPKGRTHDDAGSAEEGAATRCYAGLVSRPPKLTEPAEERFWSGVRETERFFMGRAEVQQAVHDRRDE